MIKRNFFILLALLVMQLPLSLCCGNNSSGSNNESGNETKYVTLSMSSRNSITRGKDIFNTVMKKYQPVIDFYGKDSEDFQELVNTNLLLNAESLVAPSAGLYSYDSLKLWGESEFIVQYEDGTNETLPVAEILTINGDASPDWFKDGKKIAGFLSKLADADNVRKDAVVKLNELSVKVEKISVLSDLSGPLADLSKDFDKLKKLTSCLSAIGKAASVFGAAFGLAESLGLFDTGPSPDEIINMKLDHIIKLIEGLYTHLEYIEGRLDEIENVVVNKANKSIQLELKSIMNTVNGQIQELEIQVNSDMKKTVAMEFILSINGYLQSYIDYSCADFDNYLEYMIKQEQDENYSPIKVLIQVPWFTHQFFLKDKYTTRTLPSDGITITNPVQYLPFSYEGLEYLKNLLWTRLNLNSFTATDEEELNAVNSNTILNYLGNDTNYIAGLREEIKKVYLEYLPADLQDVNNSVLVDALNYYNAGIINFGSAYNTHPVYDSYPSIIIGSGDSIELSEKSGNIYFLEDVAVILDSYYKSKTSSLLEFAASLASLEVQLAAYLDDEDYEKYKND